MDAMQFLRGVDDPTAPYTLPHLGLVPSYQRSLDAIYPGEDSRQRAYDVTRADFERLLGLGRVDMLKGFIASRLSGTMYEDINELAFALGRSVDELQYYLNADPLELLRQAEAQQEAVRLAQIAANNERIRLQQEAERLAAEEAQRQSIAEAQRMVAETAARDAARTAQLIAQSEARLRDEVRQQWPTGDIDRQITLYEQLRTQPPRSDAEVQSIIRDAIGDGAEFQLLMRYINNWRAGIEPAETFRQIQIEQEEARVYELFAPARAARAKAEADLAANLQYLAENGLVPVKDMITIGAWTQEQIDLAARVQADRLAKEQAAFQAEIDRQDAERSARVQAEIAQAAAAEAERVRLYIADQQAQAQARHNAEQAALEAERARVAAARAAFEQEQAAAAQAQAAAAQAAEAAAIKRLIDEAAARAAAQRDLDALAEAQALQQIVNESIAQAAVANFLPGASLMTINLPADWDSYFPDDKIIWFNANQITPSQLIAAGVSAADIAWMQANGYVVRDIVAAPEVESMRPKSVDDFKSYVEGLAASDMPKRQALSSVYQYFMSNFTNGQNFSMPVLIAWLRSRPAFGDGAIIVILGKYAFDGLTNSEVFLRIAAETGLAPKSIDEVEMLMGVDELPFVVAEEPSRQIVAPEVVTAPAAPSDKNASIPTTPSMPVTKPVTPAQPAAGAGAGLLLALASLYFLGS